MSEWWRGAVIYQIYPRSFQDSNGDGIGDLKGIIARLPHVASLGADAIWLSPIFTSPMGDMGYDVSDYLNIDPLFGTLADFDQLLVEAHGLGLKVIVDQVISHSSAQHPWFIESRTSATNDKADWYVWADPLADGSPPNNWLSVFGGSAWEWDSRRRQYYLHNFLPSQPDLNFHNPKVQDAMLDVLKFWLDRGIDGFRMDTVNYYFHDLKLRDNGIEKRKEKRPPANPNEMQDHRQIKTQPENLPFLERMRALTDPYEDRMLVGEVGENAANALRVMAEYTSGRRLHMAYSFDMLGPDFTAEHFRSRIEGFFKVAPDGWPSWSFSNHDVERHVTRWAPEHGVSEAAMGKLAIAMLSAFEGTIGLYQGEELGQTETDILYEELTDPPGIRFWPDYKGRDGCRTPMVWDGTAHAGFTDGVPWLPIKAPQLAKNVETQLARNDSVLHTYKSALAFRRSRVELIDGKTTFIDLPEPLLAFHRQTPDHRLTCIFNLGKSAVVLKVGGQPGLVGPSESAIFDAGELHLGGNGFCYLDSRAMDPAPDIELIKSA
ncbi:MAG: alpha-amylase family glycosyl hydrolase [Deltaproteobacteria bacterium]